MIPKMSVVIPVYNGAETLAECLQALQAQSLPANEYEITVVNDGSTDKTEAVVERFGVKLLRQPNKGEAAARNVGTHAAQGEWVVFTDADCVPTRTWLSSLLQAVYSANGSGTLFGAAGPVLSRPATSTTARFVALTGGIDTARHLAHPTFPYAPLGNVMYRRRALEAVGGLDERYSHYAGPDLYHRLAQHTGGAARFAPRAVVFHRERETWRSYWRQQFGYGQGYGQFLIHYRQHIPWGIGDEVSAWGKMISLALAACWPGQDDRVLVRRGMFVKQLAQRLGFASAYWNRAERRRW